MSKQAKILIADDESSLRTLLRAVISAEDKEFEIIEAVDGDDACAKIQTDRPDLVILDVMMPGQSGFEVCEKVKKNPELKETIILILTAKGQETDKEWANSVGADKFLTKPFSPLELLETVRNLLKERQVS